MDFFFCLGWHLSVILAFVRQEDFCNCKSGPGYTASRRYSRSLELVSASKTKNIDFVPNGPGKGQAEIVESLSSWSYDPVLRDRTYASSYGRSQISKITKQVPSNMGVGSQRKILKGRAWEVALRVETEAGEIEGVKQG